MNWASRIEFKKLTPSYAQRLANIEYGSELTEWHLGSDVYLDGKRIGVTWLKRYDSLNAYELFGFQEPEIKIPFSVSIYIGKQWLSLAFRPRRTAYVFAEVDEDSLRTYALCVKIGMVPEVFKDEKVYFVIRRAAWVKRKAQAKKFSMS